MAQPPPYNRAYSFADFQAENPTTPLPGQSVDEEYARVKQTLDAILDNLKKIQRDDTALANRSVGYDQLKEELNGFGFNPPSEWAPDTNYVERDTVFYDSSFYRCVESHVSGSAFDSSKWAMIADFTSATTEARAARDDAQAAQLAAENAQSAAESAASDAQGYASTASSAKTAAENAASDAQGYAVAASNSAGAAALAKTAAENAQTAAEGAQQGAEDAQAAAEAAQQGAEAAQSAASAAVNAGFIFDAEADAQSANIPPILDFIRTAGYATAGDGGGALYKRVGSNPNVGPELQTNGSFTSDTAWTKVNSAVIADGKCTFSGTSATIAQPIAGMRGGKIYRVQYRIVDAFQAGGGIMAQTVGGVDSSSSGVTRRVPGTYVDYIEAKSTHTSVRFYAFNAGGGSIDDVLVNEVTAGQFQSADGAWWADPFYADQTFQVPSDFATLQDAFDFFSRTPVRNGARIIINIEGGHQLTHGFRIENCDLSHMVLTSDDEVVQISENFVPVSNQDLDAGVPRTNKIAFLAVAAKMPEWDVVVDCANYPLVRGYTLNNGSYGYVRPQKGVINVDGGSSTGMCLNLHASRIDGYQSVWSGAGQDGISITVSSIANLSRATSTGNARAGLDVSRGSVVYFFEGNASGNARGAYCRRSWLTANGADFSDSTEVSLWAAIGSHIDATQAIFNGGMPTSKRILCGGGSFVSVDGATANGSPISDTDLLGSVSGVSRMNFVSGFGIVLNSAVADGGTAAVTSSSTLTTVSGNSISIDALSYATIYEVASGGRTIYGGAIWGAAVGCRITVDGVVVLDATGLTGGDDSSGDFFSVFNIPPIVAKNTLKIEAYNRSSAGARNIGWHLVRN